MPEITKGAGDRQRGCGAQLRALCATSRILRGSEITMRCFPCQHKAGIRELSPEDSLPESHRFYHQRMEPPIGIKSKKMWRRTVYHMHIGCMLR